MALRRTVFHEFHKEAGARLIDFGGWDMPVQYAGILQEHAGCRNAVGLFDVSHMGEVRFRGPKALAAVQYLVTNDVTKLADGQAQYTAMLNERGGIVDDLIVYRVGEEDILICVNGANREKDYAWMVAHNPLGAEIVNEHEVWAQLAVQGRHAQALLQELTDVPLADIKYYWFTIGTMCGVQGCVIARTGYTGEDGFEVWLPAGAGDIFWNRIHEVGAKYGLVNVGLGARDTLRLEMKMCLYGNDITDDTNPLEAGLGWVTKLEKGDFFGRDKLVGLKPTRKLVGMVVADKIARHGCNVLHGDQVVGVVTSGTRSPSLGTNIAIAYVPTELSKIGTKLAVDVRGAGAEATIVKTPFYTRPY